MQILAQKVSKSHLKCERHGDQQIVCDRTLCLLCTFSSGTRPFFHKEGSKGKNMYKLFLKGLSIHWKQTLPLVLLGTSWFTYCYQRIAGKVTCWVGRTYGIEPQPTLSLQLQSDTPDHSAAKAGVLLSCVACSSRKLGMHAVITSLAIEALLLHTTYSFHHRGKNTGTSAQST